jgi:hypothetical protein
MLMMMKKTGKAVIGDHASAAAEALLAAHAAAAKGDPQLKLERLGCHCQWADNTRWGLGATQGRIWESPQEGAESPRISASPAAV